MKRRFFAAAMAFSTLAAGGAARADWNSFWHRVELDIHRNNSWPEPFPAPDRAAARAPFGLMAAKGWQLNCTLGDQDFDPESNLVNRTGAAKIRTVLQNASPDRRAVYVLAAIEKDATAARVDSVQREISGKILDGPMPPVLVTDLRPPTTPAEDVASVIQRYHASQRPPMIPSSTGGANGASGGAGAGAGAGAGTTGTR
jgi:hypothetical protein